LKTNDGSSFTILTKPIKISLTEVIDDEEFGPDEGQFIAKDLNLGKSTFRQPARLCFANSWSSSCN